MANLFLLRQGHRDWGLYFFASLLSYSLYVQFSGALNLGMTGNKIILLCTGLLVGMGTYIGNGCTTGHGVCGSGCLSVRSIVAICTFMAFGMITVYIMNQLMTVKGV